MDINDYGFGQNGLDMIIKLSNNIPKNKTLIVEYLISSKEFKCGRYINNNVTMHIYSKKRIIIYIKDPITKQQVLNKLFIAMRPNALPQFIKKEDKKIIIEKLKQSILFIINNDKKEIYQTSKGKLLAGGYLYYTVEMKEITEKNIIEACKNKNLKILSVIKNDKQYKDNNFRLIKGNESTQKYLKKITELKYDDTKELINGKKLLNMIIDNAIEIIDNKIIIAQKII